MDDLEKRLTVKIDDLDKKLTARITDVEKSIINLDSKVDRLESRLTIKLGLMLAASMGIVSALISFK